MSLGFSFDLVFGSDDLGKNVGLWVFDWRERGVCLCDSVFEEEKSDEGNLVKL